jgi:hypothetical protein
MYLIEIKLLNLKYINKLLKNKTMGTRNLTMVISKGQTKVAQYGQWDGYPDGVGVSLLTTLRNTDLMEKFLQKLPALRFLDREGKDKEFIESYDKNTPEWSNEPDNRTEEQKRWWETFQSRNLADEVIVNIANSNDEEIVLLDKTAFAADSLFCEWAYVVDLDKNTFEVYEGFNKKPLEQTDRFYHLQKEGEEYSPVKLVASFELANLPSDEEFLATFKTEEETEEERY